MDDEYYQYYYDEESESIKDHDDLEDGWIENFKSVEHNDANPYMRFLKTI